MRTAHRAGGFTLLELLVVIGLIATMSFVLIVGWGDGGASAALQSGQSMMINLVTAARTRSPATGCKTRLLVNTEVSAPDRYLRFIVLQLARQPGTSPTDWDTVATFTLPEGVYVLPAAMSQPEGLVTDIAAWKRVSDPAAVLGSEVFQNQALTLALAGDPSVQSWTGVGFTPNGTLAPLAGGPPPRGWLVLTLGVRRSPGSYLPGHSPVQLVNPDAVRGLQLSAYGVPALLNERSSF